tara:strand:+ start:649 stop:759 length:111 start_codon:yes stop_codon:yes gene_type:complete
MEHLEEVEQLKEEVREPQVVVLMEGMELSLLGYQHR